jgi:hypothetical protein
MQLAEKWRGRFGRRALLGRWDGRKRRRVRIQHMTTRDHTTTIFRLSPSHCPHSHASNLAVPAANARANLHQNSQRRHGKTPFKPKDFVSVFPKIYHHMRTSVMKACSDAPSLGRAVSLAVQVPFHPSYIDKPPGTATSPAQARSLF